MQTLRLLMVASALALTSCAMPASGFGMPLKHASSRPMLLTFGLYVTPDPAHNPIDPPERFSGYHTALDFEVFEGEMKKDVPVYAICDGEVIASEFAEGYGGVIVQRCLLNGGDVTVIYGHLNRESMVKTGTQAERGDRIALLGEHKSTDSDGTRKHLHLGIHKGRQVVLLGYVQTPEELNNFVDPAEVLGLPASERSPSAESEEIR